MKYKCIKRLTTDGGKTIHEVGEIVELSDADAESALKQGAVIVQPDPQPEPQPMVPQSKPTLDEVEKEAEQLEQQVQEMEQEGAKS